MIIPQKQYDKWHDLVLHDLQIDKILPRTKPLPISPRFHKNYKRIQWHKRAKNYARYDLLKKEKVQVERELPAEYKRGLTFNDAYITLCPNPFSIDLYRGGHVCYGCVYCFSIRCETALLSSFYDNWKKVLHAPLDLTIVEKQFKEAPKKDDMVSKAINRRLVLHAGNNIENYIPRVEDQYKVGLDFLKLMKDLDYPVILNTKSDIWDRPEYFKLLSEMDNVMVQETILTKDDKTGKKIEPFAPTVSRRLEVLKKLNESGIKAVVRAEPYMYTISPTLDGEIDDFIDKLLDAHIPYINVGAYNTSVQSEEISSLFAQTGFSFTNLLNSQMGFYQTLSLEKALFKFRDAGIKTGSFNPASYPLQDAVDCCGYTFQGEKPKCGLDKFNTVEVAREIMRRGEMSWEDVMRWARPIYSDAYIQRFKDFWYEKPFRNVWWGNWSFGGRVHGMERVGEDTYRYNPQQIIDKRLHMKEIIEEVMK